MAPPPPLIYQLICSVCEGEYCGKSEWLNHLSEESHQNLARQQVLKEWDPKVRTTCLIVFTKKPLTSADQAAKEMLEYFGGIVASAPVCDFVWWRDRGNIGILRFESRGKVKQVLTALGCHRDSKRVRLGSQWIYVKAGFKLDQIEWGALLPAEEKEEPLPSTSGVTPVSVPPAPPKKKKKSTVLQPVRWCPPNQQSGGSAAASRPLEYPSPLPQLVKAPPVLVNNQDLDSNQDNPSDHSHQRNHHCQLQVPSKRAKLASQPLNQEEEDEDDLQVIAIIPQNTKSLSLAAPSITITENVFTSNLCTTQRPPEPMTRTSHPLQFEFWAIRKATLIPDDLYQKGLEAVKSLKQILSLLYVKLEVAMFRNWNLKLKDPSGTLTLEEMDDDILVFIYVADSLNDILNLGIDKKMRVFLSENDNQITNQFTVLDNRSDKLQIIYLPTNVKITVVTPKVRDCLEEVQLCRLMEYMCQFDPRCHGVITLACYWVKLNCVKIWGDDYWLEDKMLHPKYTVPWLVLFFLCKVELIPSVRNILGRNPDKFLKKAGEAEEDCSDVGYHGNSSYVEEWRGREGGLYAVGGDGEKSEEFVEDLLCLLKEFLKFCENDLRKGASDLILSTHDGLVIDGSSPLAVMRAQRDGKVKMGTREVVAVERVQEEIRIRRMARGQGAEDKDDKRIWVMIHPFLWDWRFSLGEDIEEGFKMAGVGVWKMEGFLEKVKREGGNNAVFGYESLENVLRVMEMGMEEDD